MYAFAATGEQQHYDSYMLEANEFVPLEEESMNMVKARDRESVIAVRNQMKVSVHRFRLHG